MRVFSLQLPRRGPLAAALGALGHAVGGRAAHVGETVLFAGLLDFRIVVRLFLMQALAQPLGRRDVQVEPGQLLEEKLRQPVEGVVVRDLVVDPFLTNQLVRVQIPFLQKLEDGAASLRVPVCEMLVAMLRTRRLEMVILVLVLLQLRLNNLLDRHPILLPVRMVWRDLLQGHAVHHGRVCKHHPVVAETQDCPVDLWQGSGSVNTDLRRCTQWGGGWERFPAGSGPRLLGSVMIAYPLKRPCIDIISSVRLWRSSAFRPD